MYIGHILVGIHDMNAFGVILHWSFHLEVYKAGDGTGEDGLCIDIVGWHAVQGEAGKKPLQTMVLCYIIMLNILH